MRSSGALPVDVPVGSPGGDMVPGMPTTPAELMEAWGIPSEAYESTTVKTSRNVRGSNQWMLLASVPLPDWNLEDVAARFGPGSYRIVCGNGPSRLKNSTVHVSPQFAENAGWAAAPPQAPDPLQVHAAQTFRKVTDSGAVSREELAAMIQVAVNNARPASSESGLDAFLKGFNIANELSMKAMDQAKGMLGIAPAAPSGDEASWPAVILQLAPTILDTLKTAFAVPPQPPPADPSPQARPSIAAAQAQEPSPMPHPESAAYPPPPPETVPLLNLMKQFAPMLKGPMEGPEPPETMADQLTMLVGPAMDDAVIATAEHVKAQGPGIFGHVAPWMVSDRAAAVVIAWAAKIQEQV